jgi:hypothetical protein
VLSDLPTSVKGVEISKENGLQQIVRMKENKEKI